jgi:hypothetical protein
MAAQAITTKSIKSHVALEAHEVRRAGEDAEDLLRLVERSDELPSLGGIFIEESLEASFQSNPKCEWWLNEDIRPARA